MPSLSWLVSAHLVVGLSSADTQYDWQAKDRQRAP